MSKVEHPLSTLSAYLPDNSFDAVVHYINLYKVFLTVTKKRKTVLGDYRHSSIDKNHRISINGNLNKYEFLITLLHELAHLLTFEQFGFKAEAHGKEWKLNYKNLLVEFCSNKIFPSDVELALLKTIHNPAATANGEIELITVLRKYNLVKKEGVTTVQEISTGELFETENGKIFKKGNQRRKRYECVELSTKKLYSFSAIAEVKLINA